MASSDEALRLDEVNTNQGFPFKAHSLGREIKWVIPSFNASDAA